MTRTGVDAYGPLRTAAEAAGLRRVSADLLKVEGSGNLGALGFTKSKFSTPEMAAVSCHISVRSARLSAVFGPPLQVEFPEPWPANHWMRAAGFIDNVEFINHPWPVVPREPSSYGAAIADLIDRVIPALLRHLSDEGLRDDWLTHEDPWLPELAQLAYTFALVRDVGPEGRLKDVESRIRRLLSDTGIETPGYVVVGGGLRQLGLSAPGTA